MPVCEIASEVGDRYRYEWEAADGSQRFGFEGELLAHERACAAALRVGKKLNV